MTNKWSSFGNDQRVMNDWRAYMTGDKVEGWYGLVKEEYNKLLLESGRPDLLEEGFWEKAKYYMGKFGSLEKGGKIFGRGKAEREAKLKLANAIDNASNKLVKELDVKMREEFPEFPNMEKQEEWVKALLNVGAVYDSIVAATEKDPKDPEYLDSHSANAVIKTLRLYTRHQLDYKLSDIYKHFKECLD